MRRTSLLLVAVLASAAFGSGEPQDSIVYKNFVRASRVLDEAIAAHGGAKLLDRTVDLRVSFTGTLVNEGHFARPWAQLAYPLEGTLVYSAEAGALKVDLTQQESGQRFSSFIIVGPTNGLALGAGKTRPDAMPEADVEPRLREELEIFPQEYLRQARAGAAGLRFLSGAVGQDVLTYTLGNGESRALYLDSKTHLLTRVERLDHWKHKGDRLEWRTFSRYVDRNGIKVPLRSEVHVEGGSTQHNVITEITRAEFGAGVGVDELRIPVAYRAGFEDWTPGKPKPNDANEPLPSHELGRGVTIIDLPPSTARSLLVAFSDFSVIVEAGDYSEISSRLLTTADRLLPDKPVRYVAMTHHHPLYANGLRPYAQRGITILATAGNVDYYRDLTTRPYRIRPDAQQLQPREPRIEVIDGTRIIEDATQRLELHEFDYSTHTDEFVLPYLPSHKLIVTGDTVYILRGKEPTPARSRELAVHRLVREKKLDVEQIMQTWFLAESDPLVPYAALEEKVRLAQAKDAKP